MSLAVGAGGDKFTVTLGMETTDFRGERAFSVLTYGTVRETVEVVVTVVVNVPALAELVCLKAF